VIATIQPSEEKNNNNNKTVQRPRRTLYCIGCDSTKEADCIVGKNNIPLCEAHWEVYSKVVLEKRSIEEEEELI
jgi:hypothetical protein